LTHNKENISGKNAHLTSWFYEDELSLNSLLNMVSKFILVRFVGPIVSRYQTAIKPPTISSPMHEIPMS